MRSFLAALTLLTILPVPIRQSFSAEEVARSRYGFPFVGLLLGFLLGGWLTCAAQLGTPMFAAFLVLAAWILLTGALHVDGYCDLCDGLWAGRTPEDRLHILQDPHVGTFGLVGAILLLLGKWTILVELVTRFPELAPWAVAAAVCTGRCLVLVMAGAGPYPRPKGTGKILIEATTPWQAGWFAVAGCTAAVALLFRVGWLAAFGAFLLSLLVVLALARLCLRRLGGITGDCLGAAIEVTEISFLFAIVVLVA